MSQDILHLWYSALSSPAGIEIEVSDFDAVRMRLYKARAEAKDTDLQGVALCASPFDPMKLWLVKRNPSDETP
jgi:hypothetical protein